MKLFGHPVHQQLIVFPLGLLSTAIIFDIIALISSNPFWFQIAFWLIVAGVVGGLAAAVFGFIDWLGIPANTRAKRIALWHGGGNLLVLVLFAGSWWLRNSSPRTPATPAVVLSFVGVMIAIVCGWLGGELVNRMGVGGGRGREPKCAQFTERKASPCAHQVIREAGRVRFRNAIYRRPLD